MKMITNVGTHLIDTQGLLLRRFEYSDNASMCKYWVYDKNVLYLSWTCLYNWIRGQRTSWQIYRLISEWRLLSLDYNRQEYLWMYWSDCIKSQYYGSEFTFLWRKWCIKCKIYLLFYFFIFLREERKEVIYITYIT